MNPNLRETASRYKVETESFTVSELLSFILDKHRGKAAFSTSMGAEDQVITRMLADLGLPVKIFTLDTGRLFQETYELIQITQARYHLPIEIYFPDSREVEKMVNEKGINLFYDSIENRKRCCNVRKIEPLQRALQGMEIWITGLRKEQSVTREAIEMVGWDEDVNLIKINPLCEWTHDQVWQMVREEKIPYNTLHDKGFPSIGCLPCTRAILHGEPIRAGRWWWEDSDLKECGLHISHK
jgi:phosphoadenosine phosphosulfate reductase